MTITLRRLLALTFCAPALTLPLKANIITFLDATDYGGSVEVVTTNSNRVTVTYPSFLFGGPEVSLTGPSPGATVATTSSVPPGSSFGHINIGEYDTGNQLTNLESDVLGGNVLGSVVELNWFIQPDAIPSSCLGENGCFVFEDGLTHALASVTWSDGTIDTINFQSTPEPSFIILLAAVISLMGIATRGRRP